MSAFAAPIDVLRSAMIHLGHQPPTTLNDQNPNVVAFNAIYEPLVRAELVKPSWRFATKIGSLVYQGETTIGPQFQYAMPPDVLQPRYLMLNRFEFRDYEVMGQKILVEEQADYELVYVWRVPEAQWPGDFGDAIAMMVASRLPFGSSERKRELKADAEISLLEAAGRDANTGRGNERVVDSRLVRAWMNRARREDRYGRPA